MGCLRNKHPTRKLRLHSLLTPTVSLLLSLSLCLVSLLLPLLLVLAKNTSTII